MAPWAPFWWGDKLYKGQTKRALQEGGHKSEPQGNWVAQGLQPRFPGGVGEGGT